MGTLLFAGFPSDAEWSRVEATVAEVGGMKYANHATWVTLSGGSRLVRDGAANVEAIAAPENANANIIAVAREVERGQSYPPLIAAGLSSDGTHVLVEGHTRATAYVRTLGGDEAIELIVGHSQKRNEWAFY